MSEPTKLENIGRAVAMVIRAIESEGARPEAIIAMKMFVESHHVELRAKTRGGLTAVVIRLDETASDDPEALFSQVLDGMKLLAAKDAPA